MFGYVRLMKPEIKMGEYEQYQGIYCTLCRRLGKRYGLTARLTLSYDMTFLALLTMALEPADPGFCPGRCSFNPAKRCLKCRNTAAIDKAADLGTILAYYKLKDVLRDEGFFKKCGAVLAMLPASLRHRKAAKRHPAGEAAVAAMMEAQAAVEQAKTPSLDAAAEPFARCLEALAEEAGQNDRDRQILRRFGYCLGRWIYLIDAVDDLTEDMKKRRYNPFVIAWEITAATDLAAVRKRAEGSLNACLGECIAAYNLLEINRFDGILRNILEKGMPAAQRKALTGEEKHHG